MHYKQQLQRNVGFLAEQNTQFTETRREMKQWPSALINQGCIFVWSGQQLAIEVFVWDTGTLVTLKVIGENPLN